MAPTAVGQCRPAAHPGVRARGARTGHSSNAATLPHPLEPSGGLIEKQGGCSPQVLTRRGVTVARRHPSQVEGKVRQPLPLLWLEAVLTVDG
jgi:hypothetical protein